MQMYFKRLWGHTLQKDGKNNTGVEGGTILVGK